MKFPAPVFAVFAALAVSLPPSPAATSYRVTVAAAEVDRLALTGAFVLPPGAPSPAQLRDTSGHTYPLQVEASGLAR